MVAIEDKFKAFRDWTVNLYFSPCLRKVVDDALDRNVGSERNNLSTLQRPEARIPVTGAFDSSAIFEHKRAIDKRKRIKFFFHDPPRTQKCGKLNA